jgi:hypothetical protein
LRAQDQKNPQQPDFETADAQKTGAYFPIPSAEEDANALISGITVLKPTVRHTADTRPVEKQIAVA